jgi:hypothetical protein
MAVGVTVSHQRPGQLSQPVREALEGAAARVQCVDKGYPVTVSVGRAQNTKNFRLTVPQYEFKELPTMSPRELRQVRENIYRAYGPDPVEQLSTAPLSAGAI